jgi:hypothetical protein
MWTDKKGHYIFQSEVVKAIKVVKCQRSVVDDDVPGDVIRLLGEDYLRLTM